MTVQPEFECPQSPGNECQPAERWKCSACGRTIVGPSCLDCRRKDEEIERLRAEIRIAKLKLATIDANEREFPRPVFADWSTAVTALDMLTRGDAKTATELANRLLCAPATLVPRTLGDAPEAVLRAFAWALRGANGLHPPPDPLVGSWDELSDELRARWVAYAERVHMIAEWLWGVKLRSERNDGG